jgi:hypothetical protein
MGQFENYGIQPVGEIGLPKRGNRASFERVENKPKPKPKTQAQAAPPRSPGDGRNWRTDEEALKKKFRNDLEKRNKKNK